MTNSDIHDQADSSPICAVPFKPEDICAADIEMGTCHAACLDGSPIVDLETGDEIPDVKFDTYPYSEVMEQAPSAPAHSLPAEAAAHGQIFTPCAVDESGESSGFAAIPTPPPQTHMEGREPPLDWSNFDGPKRNIDWKPDDQDLIYTAINYRDDDYGDADEDVGQQLVERLLAAWKTFAVSEQITFENAARLLKERDAGEKARAEQWRLRRDAEGSRDAAYAAADSLRVIRDAAAAYVASVNGEPEKDCWDTEDGKEAPGAERFASDWAWKAYDEAKQKAFDDLRAALSATTEGSNNGN